METIGHLLPGGSELLTGLAHVLLPWFERPSGPPTESPLTTYPTTSMPIERAVPATVLNADSIESQFRSGILSFAMSSTCFFVTVPTLFLLGSLDPLARFAAR